MCDARNRHPLTFLLAVFCLLAAGVLHAAPFEGRIVKSDGQVSVTGAGGETIDLAAAGNVIREAQTISTGADGTVVVRFNNGAITVLDPNSRLQVKTPNWFVHLAGKAFFAFKRLVGQTDERRVQNTVALIGIRGTEFISYETDQTAVALDEGSLTLQTLGNAFRLDEAGAQSDVAEFVLEEKQLVTFDGTAAMITAFTPAVLADFAAFRAFGGDLLGDFAVDFTPEVTAGAADAAAATTAAAATEDKPDDRDDGSSGGGFYFGLGIGLSQTDADGGDLEGDLTDAGNTIDNLEFDDASEAGKVFAGYYFTRHFGVEVGYSDLGEFESEIDSASATQALADDVEALHPVSPQGVYAAGVARVNLLLVSLIFKAGIYSWEGDVETSLPGGLSVDDEQDGTDLMYGVGVGLPIVPIRVELERYEVDDDSVDVLSASLVFHF